MAANYEEEKLQIAWVKWYKLAYPKYKKLLCYNFSNSKSLLEGKRNKAKGLQEGRSDLVLYFKGKATHIEIKTPKGVQSEAQKEWQSEIEKQGFEYRIVRNFNEFQYLISHLLK